MPLFTVFVMSISCKRLQDTGSRLGALVMIKLIFYEFWFKMLHDYTTVIQGWPEASRWHVGFEWPRGVNWG